MLKNQTISSFDIQQCYVEAPTDQCHVKSIIMLTSYYLTMLYLLNINTCDVQAPTDQWA